MGFLVTFRRFVVHHNSDIWRKGLLQIRSPQFYLLALSIPCGDA
jgi:hypothetical protein